MHAEEQIAVEEAAEPLAPVAPEKSPADNAPKRLPPFGVFVLNDHVHSFDYVVGTFMKVFGYSADRALRLAMFIHQNGRGLVWSGSKEVGELKIEQIRGAGPDFHAAKKIEGPLGAYLEPLPG